MNETPTPPEGYSIIPRAYLEAGNPLPKDALWVSQTGGKWELCDLIDRVTMPDDHRIFFFATAQPLPCFQKGGDEPCAQKETESLSGITPPTPPGNGSEKKRTSASNAPVAVQSPEHNPDGLTPEQYGAPEWRLLTLSDRLLHGDEYWNGHEFEKVYDPETRYPFIDSSYRRRRIAPEPAAPTVHPDTVARFAEIDAAEQRIAEIQSETPEVDAATSEGWSGDAEATDPVTARRIERERNEAHRMEEKHLERIAELERQLAEARAENETWKEIHSGVEESARNLASFSDDDSQFHLPMSGAHLTARDCIRRLRYETSAAAEHINKLYRDIEAAKQRASDNFNRLDAATSELSTLRAENELLKKFQDDITTASLPKEVPISYAQLASKVTTFRAQLAAIKKDRERLDWLALRDVEVREPLVYGSKRLFIATPKEIEGEDDEPSNLRAAIDAAMKEAK